MGMFDYVSYKKTNCYVCGAPIDNYQSKSGECTLATLTPEELLRQSDEPEATFYGYCNDDDWNSNKPHHQNLYRVTQGPLRIELAQPAQGTDKGEKK